MDKSEAAVQKSGTIGVLRPLLAIPLHRAVPIVSTLSTPTDSRRLLQASPLSPFPSPLLHSQPHIYQLHNGDGNGTVIINMHGRDDVAETLSKLVTTSGSTSSSVTEKQDETRDEGEQKVEPGRDNGV